MPPHLKPEDPRLSGVSELDVRGNVFADDQAGGGAATKKGEERCH